MNERERLSIVTMLIDRTISLTELTFHYLEAGEPAAPPLVLLHALGCDAHDWNEIVPALARGFHVFALDQRGHGESARPGTYTFEAMRDDLHEFVDALSLDRFTLIGHSMGGTVAILFAEQWPERIERLVLEDTPPPFRGTAVPEPPDEPPEDSPASWKRDWPVFKSIIHELRKPESAWWNDLRRITAPTLIIGGGSTSHVPQEKLAEAARLIPDCQLMTIEGAGHAIHKNRPAEYKALLQDFLCK